MFFYNDTLKAQQPEMFIKHAHCLIRLSQDDPTVAAHNNNNKLVIVDMELHPQENAHEMRIVWFENGEQKSANFLKEKQPNSAAKNKITGKCGKNFENLKNKAF